MEEPIQFSLIVAPPIFLCTRSYNNQYPLPIKICLTWRLRPGTYVRARHVDKACCFSSPQFKTRITLLGKVTYDLLPKSNREYRASTERENSSGANTKQGYKLSRMADQPSTRFVRVQIRISSLHTHAATLSLKTVSKLLFFNVTLSAIFTCACIYNTDRVISYT